MKTTIQLLLLTWFVTVNLFILIPSFTLLRSGVDESSATQPPHPPQPPPPVNVGLLDPTLDLEKQKQQIEAYKQQVGGYAEQIKAYTQQVSAYSQQVTAYKTQQEAKPDAKRKAIYELVVKGTLLSLIASFATTLIAYVFTNLGATVVDNAIRMKNQKEPQELRLL
jgi:hypothetical protein